MNSVLFIAKNFYPDNNPQSILLKNILEHLSLNKNIDTHLFTETKKKIIIKYLKYNTYSLKIDKIWKFIDLIPFFSVYNFIKQKYSKQIDILKEYIIKNDIKILVSFSNPFLLNIISCILAKELNIKNIIHYSDPVYNTIYKKYFFSHKNFLVKTIERNILDKADHIICNNIDMIKFIFNNQKKFFFNKTTIIPHSFNAKDYVNKKFNKKNDCLIISYLGALNKIRNPILIIEVFKNLKNESLIPVNTQLNFYGLLDPFMEKYSFENKKNNKLYKIFFYKNLSYKESIKKMFESDLLLAIDARNENVYLTTKIIQYLITSKLVINITNKNSPNYKIGKKANFVYADINNAMDIKNKIIYAINNYKNFRCNFSFVNKFRSEKISKKWSQLLLSL
jgi:hypothetical protein